MNVLGSKIIPSYTTQIFSILLRVIITLLDTKISTKGL